MCLHKIDKSEKSIKKLIKNLRHLNGTKGLTLPKGKSVFAWKVFYQACDYLERLYPAHQSSRFKTRAGCYRHYPVNKWISDSRLVSNLGFHCFNTERAAIYYADGSTTLVVRKVEVDVESIKMIGFEYRSKAFTCKRLRVVSE